MSKSRIHKDREMGFVPANNPIICVTRTKHGHSKHPIALLPYQKLSKSGVIMYSLICACAARFLESIAFQGVVWLGQSQQGNVHLLLKLVRVAQSL
jgi:hypothetical protein